MLDVFKLDVFMLSVVALNVFMLSVVVPSVLLRAKQIIFLHVFNLRAFKNGSFLGNFLTSFYF